MVLAYVKGERGTRCVLGPPLVVAAFWAVVGSLALELILNPNIVPTLFGQALPGAGL